jgi:hypothetical protein
MKCKAFAMQVATVVEMEMCTCQSCSPAHPAKCHTHRANILAILCNTLQIYIRLHHKIIFSYRHLWACSVSLPSQPFGRPTTNSSAFCSNAPNQTCTQAQVSKYTTCITKHRGHSAAMHLKSLVPHCHELPQSQ